MKYYNICLDDTDYLYLGRNSKLNVQFCPLIKKKVVYFIGL